MNYRKDTKLDFAPPTTNEDDALSEQKARIPVFGKTHVTWPASGMNNLAPPLKNLPHRSNACTLVALM